MLNFLFVVDVLLFNSVKFFMVVFGLFENNVVSDLLIVFVGENFVDFFVEVFKWFMLDLLIFEMLWLSFKCL